jgi:DNA-binding XRE family transcriptional regulator
LELASAWILPGGQVLTYRLRGGQCYQLEVEALGFSGPALLASPGPGCRGVLLAFRKGGMVEVATDRLLAASEPAYREARARAAEAPILPGARLRALRLASGRTAMEVAAAAGMARSNYARLEASRHRPQLATLARVARVLGVRLTDLLGAVGDSPGHG